MSSRDKEYDYQYHKNLREQRRLMVIAFLGSVCNKCGSLDNLECDHINPETKSFTISQGLDYEWNKLKEELIKCQLLCKNCHKEKTANEQRKAIRHGTRKGYQKGCRCQLCKKAAAEYERHRYRKKFGLTPDQYRV